MLKHVRLAFLFAFLLFWAVPAVLMAQAQDARGNIVGRTTDASGAVIPGADVKGA